MCECVAGGVAGSVRPYASQARTSPPWDNVGATALAPLLYRADVSWNASGTQWKNAPWNTILMTAVPLLPHADVVPSVAIQGYLAHKKQPLSRTLQ